MTVEIRRPPDIRLVGPSGHGLPPLPSWPALERPALLRRITRAVEDAPLTLVRAPAGTGKTVAVADWARRQVDGGDPVAWLTLSERDSHPAVFGGRLQAALVQVGALAGPVDVRRRRGRARIDDLGARLLRRGRPTVIVLDAVDRLRGRAVHDQVRCLLDVTGGGVRVVLTSRVEPPLPLQRYQLEDLLAEIGAVDLALEPSEVDRVLAQHHVPAVGQLSEDVHRRTEGWVAGVRLAARRLATDGPRADLDGCAAPYVREEILAGLSPLERDVLTAAAVVDVVPPGLATALTGRRDAGAVLDALARGNAFLLPERGRAGSLRLHPLVREPLLADLDQADADAVATLHRRAAAWFEERGELEAGVRHVAAAGDWQAAAERVLSGRGLAEVIMGTSTGVALAGDLAGVPETGSADVTVLRAAIALVGGDLDRARAALDETQDRSGVAASVVRTALYDAAARPVETLVVAREARSRLERSDAPDALVTAVVATVEGAAQLRAGDLDAASAALDQAVSATVGADGPMRLRCQAELALAEACAGRLTRALELAEAVERDAAEQGVPPASLPLALDVARVWVMVERQELAQAERSLSRMSKTRAGHTDETWRAALLLLRARCLRDRGDLQGARRQLGRAGSARGSSPAWLLDQLDAESTGLATGEHHPVRRSARGTAGHVQDLLDEAEHRCRRGDVAAARTDVGRALQLGRTERLRRPFAHASPMVRSLIRHDAGVSALAGWLHPALPYADGRDAAPSPAPVLEALSKRELEVLRHLARFLTTEEIAAEMFISVNTVRTHVRRVLGKLSVSRRHEAVRRGQDLGLV